MSITIVSVPRSGHNFLYNALTYYSKQINHNFYYCEYYTCCKCRPCPNNNNAIQKSHDFGLRDPLDMGDVLYNKNKYIFLYRDNFIQQVEAYFRWEMGMNKLLISDSAEINYIENKKAQINFNKWFNLHKYYYIRIFEKYLNNKYNVLPITYEHLINSFHTYFNKILCYLQIPINVKFIHQTYTYCNPKVSLKIIPKTPNYNIITNIIKSYLNELKSVKSIHVTRKKWVEDTIWRHNIADHFYKLK